MTGSPPASHKSFNNHWWLCWCAGAGKRLKHTGQGSWGPRLKNSALNRIHVVKPACSPWIISKLVSEAREVWLRIRRRIWPRLQSSSPALTSEVLLLLFWSDDDIDTSGASISSVVTWSAGLQRTPAPPDGEFGQAQICRGCRFLFPLPLTHLLVSQCFSPQPSSTWRRTEFSRDNFVTICMMSLSVFEGGSGGCFREADVCTDGCGVSSRNTSATLKRKPSRKWL